MEARPRSLRYVAAKFLRRHAIAATAVTMAFVLLAAFGILQTVQSQRLTVERDIARQERDKAELLSDLLAEVLNLADPRAGGDFDRTAHRLLGGARQRILHDFSDLPEAQAELMTRVGRIYERLGYYDMAEELLDRAVEIWRRERGLDDPAAASTLDALGFLYVQQGDPRAVETLRRALDLRLRMHGEEHVEVAETLAHLAAALRSIAADEEAISLLRRAVVIDHRLGMERTAEGASRLAEERLRGLPGEKILKKR